MDKKFFKQSIAKLSILAILFNIFSTSFFTSTTFGEYSQNTTYTHTNSIGTMTGVSSFSTQTGTIDYLNTGNNQDKVNTLTGTKLDFSFELSDIYSGALIKYNYFTSTGTAPVASGSYIYTGGQNSYNNNINVLTSGLTGTGLNLTLTGLVNGIYHIGIIPGNGETFEEYMTGNVGEKVIYYEFIVGDFGITQKTGTIDFITNKYPYNEAFTGEIAQNNITLVLTGVNFSYETYNVYYNTGSENILFNTGVFYQSSADKLNIDLKNIPATLTGVNLVVGLVSSGSEYKTTQYPIRFDTTLVNFDFYNLPGGGVEESLSGKYLLGNTGSYANLGIKSSNQRLIDFTNAEYFLNNDKLNYYSGGLGGSSPDNTALYLVSNSGSFYYEFRDFNTLSLMNNGSRNRKFYDDNVGGIQEKILTFSGITDKLGRLVSSKSLKYKIYPSYIGNFSLVDEQLQSTLYQSGIILSATGVSSINYSDNQSIPYNIDFTLSGNTIKEGQTLVVDLEGGSANYSLTGSVNLSNLQSTGIIQLDLTNKFTNFKGNLLKAHIMLFGSGKSFANHDMYDSLVEYNINFVNNSLPGVGGGGGGGGGSGSGIVNFQTGIIKIIDSTHISLSGSLDFLRSQSWEVLDTKGPPTHYIFTESGSSTELVRISYDSYTGTTLSFQNSMSGKTLQIWGDFTTVGCQTTATGSCEKIKLTTSGTGFNSGSFTFPGVQEIEIPQTNITYRKISANNEDIYNSSELNLCELLGDGEKCYPFSSSNYLSVSITGSITGTGISSLPDLYTYYYKTYFRNNFINSGSLSNINNKIFLYNFNISSLSGTTTGTGILKTELYNGENILVSTTEKQLYLDNTLPTITGSYIKNTDGTFTLSATGSDNTGIKGIYWYGNNGSSHGAGYDNTHFGTWYAFATGSSVTLNQTQTGYYATALDYAGNFKSVKITLPNFAVETPTNLTYTGITQTGFTISWSNTGIVDSYDILLNGSLIRNVNSGTTSYTFNNLEAGKTYYVGLKAVKGNLRSNKIEKRVQTLGNSLNITLNLDENCIDSASGAYRDWMSLNLSGSGFYYNSYASKELSSTSSFISFDNLRAGDYKYDLWTGRCGYKTGTINVNNTTNQTISVSAGKWIKTIVRENTLTGNIISNYNVELTPNTSNFNWNDAKYVYVNSITGTVLNLLNDNYNLKVRDNSWVAKNIIGVYSGSTLDTNISSNSILTNSSYSSGDTLTVVVQEGNILVGTANIGDGYITLYNSGTNTWVASASIRNGKFAMMGIPSGDYKIEAYSYNYKYNNYTENLNIASDITNKNITFIQKNLDVSADFSKSFALEGKTISLKINPNQNNTGNLSFASGSEIFANAKYKVLNNSGVLVSSGIISNLDSSTSLNNIAGKTITVDLTLKNDINSEIKFVKANFGQLELSLPIVRIEYSSPATTLANTDFVIRGSASPKIILQAMYNGKVISTGSANANGAFEMIAKISTAGSGNIIVKDVTNNLLSDGSNISIGSDLPILSSYDIKVDNVSKASSSEAKIKYFSLWAKGDLTSASDLEVSTTISNDPIIKYYIGGIELTAGKLSKGTYVGYGTKDVVVEYTKNGTTYTQTIAKMIVLIDPAGYVYNKYDNLKIPGIQATLYELQDKNGNRVTATGGVDMTKIAQYTSSGYTKDDLVNTISACSGGGDLYPCSWVKYDSAGLGEEPNPQITDSEGRYAWQTPDGFYYVKFEDIDGTTNGSYDTFESLAVIIPPEVTDLNVGSNYSSGYTITETSTNYDRSKSWSGTGFTSWSYTCKNSYTGNTCETAPVSQSTGSSGGGGGGYTPQKTTPTFTPKVDTTNTTITTTKIEYKVLPKEQIKEIVKSIETKTISTKSGNIKVYIPKFDDKTNKSVDKLTTIFFKKIEKKSQVEKQKIMKQYSIFLIGLKLYKEKDSRGKTIAKNAIVNILKLIK